MSKITLSRWAAAAALGLTALLPGAAQAEQFAGGVAGVKLGMPRAEALKGLLANGIELDVERTVCLEQVADKYKPYADRICKLPTLGASRFMEMPVSKVSLMFKEDKVVLVGLEIGELKTAYVDALGKLRALLGEPAEPQQDSSASWREPADTTPRATATKLVADDVRAYFVYSDAALR